MVWIFFWGLPFCQLNAAFEKEDTAPFRDVFSSTRLEEGNQWEREILMKSLAYWQEGENLLNRCQSYTWLEHLGTREREEVLHTMMAAYQALGIDITTRAIVEYVKTLKWPSEKRHNLYQNLVQQYCSPNISLISLRGLREGFARRDREGAGLLLPQFGTLDLLPPPENSSLVMARELGQSIALFRSFCSWGEVVKRPRLLSFIFRDPQFSAFVIRKLGGVEIAYDDVQRASYLVPSEDQISINCQGPFCRKGTRESFLQFFSRLLGGEGLVPEMERVYCHHLRFLRPSIDPRNQVIKNWAQQTTEEQRNLMRGQLGALLTGVPELLLRAGNYREFVEELRPLYRRSWDYWAKRASGRLARTLSYEESLSIVRISHQGKGQRIADFKIEFQVLGGELDRILLANWRELKTHYPLSISSDVLHWVRNQSRSFNPRYPALRERALGLLQRQLAGQIASMEQKLAFLPWKRGELSRSIALELLTQTLLYKGDSFAVSEGGGGSQESGYLTKERGVVRVPVQFKYGPFALWQMQQKRLQEQGGVATVKKGDGQKRDR